MDLRELLERARRKVPKDLITPRYELDSEWLYSAEDGLRHIAQKLLLENVRLRAELEKRSESTP